MTNVDPNFPKKVKKGDIMVVGTNMGCGHSHMQANLSIKQCGISCVIAESFDLPDVGDLHGHRVTLLGCHGHGKQRCRHLHDIYPGRWFAFHDTHFAMARNNVSAPMMKTF